VPRPRRELLAHRRLHLTPGASERLTFELPLSALEFWDVAVGRTRLEPGAYELLAGASSEDIRLRTTIALTGEPATPRPVRETGLNAADFDEQRDTEIVDRTKVSGDAVSPRADATGELVHRGCDFGTGVTRVEVEASGGGAVEVSLDGGPSLATVSFGATKGPYDYTTIGAEFAAHGVHDLHLRLRGPLRLARVGFSG
jgi:beta-glucosidase